MSPFDALAARLAARAAAIAQVHAATAAARRRDPAWWRRPRLLWPDFKEG